MLAVTSCHLLRANQHAALTTIRGTNRVRKHLINVGVHRHSIKARGHETVPVTKVLECIMDQNNRV